MAKRKAKRSVKLSNEEKYKAFNSFLMLVIIFFVIFFIAQLPKRERAVKVKKAPVDVAQSPAIMPPAPPATLTTTIASKPLASIAATPPKPVVPAQKAPVPAVKPKTPNFAAKRAPAPSKPPVGPTKTQGVSARPAAITTRPVVKLAYKPAITPTKITEMPAEIKGRIAIVIDDWGYHLENLGILDNKYPITAAILPNLSYTRNVADALHGRGYEIILHLPMEPNEKLGLEKDTIMTSLTDADIRRIIDRDISEISYVRGINNHMGSRATSDLRTMEIVLKTVSRKHLYYLDSYVSSDSVCLELAEKLRVHFAKRDVFLDNQPEPDYIRNQLMKLKLLAHARGWAIGIGHDRKNTLEVLREEMPKLEKEGYRFVFVSELIK